VTEKNSNFIVQETFTNSAEFGVISQRDFFDHDISNAENIGGYYVVRDEDFVYNPRISVTAPVGPVNRNKLGRSGVMSPLYTVFRTHDIDTTYLEWFFKSSYWHPFMFFNGDSGARSDRFSIKDAVFFEMPIPLPSIDEQKEIGAYLDKIDNLITLHQCLDITCIPKTRTYTIISWEQRKLSELVTEIKRTDEQSDAPVMMITAENGFINQSERYSTNNAGQSLKKYILLEKGELAYNHGASKLRPYGSCFALTTEEKARIPFVYHCFSTETENSEFLSIVLNSKAVEKQLRRIVSSGARMDGLLNISFDEYTSIPVLLPQKDEQDRIADYFKQLDNLITLHQLKLKCINLHIYRRIIMDHFEKEVDFERALITALQSYGWEKKVIYNPTEKELIQNWADILFENNRDIDRLNDCPLIQEEMDELLEQIREKRTPLALNGFINGKTVAITRKNPDDKLHYGKEVSLKIYDRMEIAAGQSRYQIVEQPVFPRHDKVLQDRRGDLMLLINGMPVFHIELKRSGVPVQEAVNQIEKYSHEGVFTGLFSLVQVFVAMNPEETLYFANPGPDGKFNKDFYFHWADMNNDPINDWKTVVERLLSIPMAHQLIGFYTVADDADGVLKVMRSYQYYAANRISDRVSKNDWNEGNQLGGYIWHTTGSGKTMTSFKSAQLIANSKDADKVVFLMDRIELGTQSLKEYRAFADNADDVQETEDTITLISKLKSSDPKNTLIVSSIQKMSNIKEDAEGKMRAKDLETMKNKRLVFIIDECHRSTFGEMLSTIKDTFPNALFFGFTGTPVFTENEQVMSTTADIFGDELHRYSIADGIRDKNVLGFDPTMVCVYRDKDLRKRVALHESGASSEEEAVSDPVMSKKYYSFMSASEVPMAGAYDDDGKYHKGIEDYIEKEAWQTDDYQNAIVDDIMNNWMTLSRNNKFHAVFATSSIPEAIRYYRKFRERYPELKVTGLFDPSIDNQGGKKSLDKEDGLKEMLDDYNTFYGQQFDIGGYAKFKKDVSARLSHKRPYDRLKPEQQLDMLIVVNQMLTGFDSKWINTLYLDKVMVYQNLIQAFSRTNRLFNINEKPFGSIRYYRLPHTMKRNIEDAVKLFSGDRPQGLFADHLPDNVEHMNVSFKDMMKIFETNGVPDMDKLPEDTAAKAKFAKLFRDFSTYLQAARIQGFSWDKIEYSSKTDPEDEREENIIEVYPTEEQYQILLQRYKELRKPGTSDEQDGEITFTVDPYLTEQNTGVIDNDYMNSRFEKWKKQLADPNVDPNEIEATLEELHKSFAFLSQEDQKYANLFLHDVQTGDAVFVDGFTFRDYVVSYAQNIRSEQIELLVAYLGISEKLLRGMMDAHVSKEKLNEYGRFDALKATVVREKAQEYFTKVEKKKLPPFLINNRVDELLTKFILEDGFDIPDPDEN